MKPHKWRAKRIVSIALVAVMLLGMLPSIGALGVDTAYAAQNEINLEGQFWQVGTSTDAYSVSGNTISVGTGQNYSYERYDNATVTSKFSIDFTRSFEISGSAYLTNQADGFTLGFAPDPAFRSGGAGGDIGAYACPVNPTYAYSTLDACHNQIVYEVDSWGNTGATWEAEGGLSGLAYGLNGGHVALMTTDANKNVHLHQEIERDLKSKQIFSKNEPFSIIYDTTTDTLTFDWAGLVGSIVNPKNYFNADEAYFFMSCVYHQGSEYGPGGQGTLTCSTFNYTDFNPDFSEVTAYKANTTADNLTGTLANNQIVGQRDDLDNWVKAGDTVIVKQSVSNKDKYGNPLNYTLPEIFLRESEMLLGNDKVSPSKIWYGYQEDGSDAQLVPLDICNGKTHQEASGAVLNSQKVEFRANAAPVYIFYQVKVPGNYNSTLHLRSKVEVSMADLTQDSLRESNQGITYIASPSFNVTFKPGTAGAGDTITMPANFITKVPEGSWTRTNAIGSTPTKVMSGLEIVFPPEPTISAGSDYVFAGWLAEGGLGGTFQPGATQIMPSKDVTITAIWSKNVFGITYTLNGGEKVPGKNYPEKAAQGTTVKVDEPQRAGYDFAGWSPVSGGVTPDAQGEFTMPGMNITLGAEWTPKTYTIKYNANGGAGAPSDQLYVYDSNAAVAEQGTMSKGEDLFLGWSTKAPTGGDPYSLTLVEVTAGGPVNATMQRAMTASTDNSVTLYAVWKKAGDTRVIFNGNQGKIYEGDGTSNVSKTYSGAPNSDLTGAPTGDKTTPPYAARPGYIFKGWATTDSATSPDAPSPIKYPSTSVQVITYYAVWEAEEYLIQYDKDAADATGTVQDQTYTYDTSLKVRDNETGGKFTRPGYTIIGWAMASSMASPDLVLGADVNDALKAAMVQNGSQPTKLYAVWQMNGKTSISFVANGGSINVGGQEYTTTYTISDTAGTTVDSSKIPQNQNLKRVGYTFEGWSTDLNGAVAPLPSPLVTPDNGTRTYYAKWTANTYTIKYDGSAEGKTVENVPADTTYVYDSATGVSDGGAIKRNEDVFAGWAFEESRQVVSVVAGGAVTDELKEKLVASPNGTVTLYAVWRDAAKTKIIFNANSGMVDGIPMKQIVGEPNTAIGAGNVPQQIERAGYTFKGWATTEDATAPDVTIDANTTYPESAVFVVTYYAVWEANTYTIKYDANEGTNPPADTVYVFESATTIASQGSMSKGDSTFIGWSSEAPTPGTTLKANVVAGGGVSNAVKQLLIDSGDARSITLYAVWQKAQDTRVIFNGNGGELKIGSSKGPVLTLMGEPGTAIGDENVPTDLRRIGYLFAGWAEKSDATLGDIVSVDGTVQYPSALESVKTYYAVWSEKFNVKLTFEGNGGSFEGSGATQNIMENQRYGETIFPEQPVRDGYIFLGWNEDPKATSGNALITVPVSDTTYHAIWVPSQIVVSFDSRGGNSVESIKGDAESDMTAKMPPDPIKYGYDFLGWFTEPEGQGSAIPANFPTSPTTYYANWTKHAYTVTFYDVDPETGARITPDLKSETVLYMDSATAPATPSRPGYAFAGWDKSFVTITRDTDVLAVYVKDSSEQFIVTFVDKDGNTIKTENVLKGASATAPNPPKVDGMTFTGWDKDFTNVQSNLTVTAQYVPDGTPVTGKFKVTFVNDDGSIISVQDVERGNSAVAPADPIKTGHTFTGWDKGFTNVQSNLTVVAQYKKNTYTVTFVDKDGNVLKTEPVEYGKDSTPPTAPTIPGYDFVGWDKPVDDIKGDTTITAQYVEKTPTDGFNVIFKDWDGTVIKTEKVKAGEDGHKPQDPTREGYKFSGWAGNYRNVQQTEIVTAVYEKLNLEYLVTFIGISNNVIDTQNVAEGTDAVAPAAPVEPGYHFVGWDRPYTNIKGPVTVKAVYVKDDPGTDTEGKKLLNVVFLDWNNVVLDIQQVPYGSDAVAPADPYKPNAAFIGWDKTFTNVQEELVITAQYSKSWGTVTFVLDANTSFTTPNDPKQSQKVTLGDKVPKVPNITVKEGYKFIGWKLDPTSAVYYTSEEVINYVVNADTTWTAYTIGGTGGGGGTPGGGGSSGGGGTGGGGGTPGGGGSSGGGGGSSGGGGGGTSGGSGGGSTGGSIGEGSVPGSSSPGGTFGHGDVLLNTKDHLAYIVGYEDNTVRPGNSITRAEVVTIFYRLLEDNSRNTYRTTQNSFKDMTGQEWYLVAASTMDRTSVVKGYTDGTFGGQRNITRAELATIIARFYGMSTYSGADKFNDVSGHWAQQHINFAASKGWIEGYADGTFKPDQQITRAETITMLNRILERNKLTEAGMLSSMKKWSDNPINSWYYLNVQEATNGHAYTRDGSGYEKWSSLLPIPDWKE